MEVQDDTHPNTMEGDVTSKHKIIRTVAKKYLVFAGGFLLCFGPFIAMLSLQSSINIEEGVGTLALGIAYAVSVAIGLFLAPIAVRRIGTNWVMIIGEMTYTLYIAANFYPKKWVMFTAGTLVGAGEALIWTVLPMYLWHFGYFHGQAGTKSFEVYVRKYTGIFYSVFQIAQIFGSALSYGILYGYKNKNESFVNNGSVTEYDSNFGEKYQYCGANDCQDQNVTEDQIGQFIPENALSLRVLIGVFCALCVLAVVIHIFLLPRAATRYSVNNSVPSDEDASGEKSAVIVSSHGKDELSYWSALKATFRHSIDTKQLLLVPLLLYIGLENTIILAEVTRAFVSCLLGVEQMGMVIIPFAVFNGIVSLLVPKLIGRFGRNKVMLVTLVVDMANYIFCLAWRPQEDTKYLLYIIFFAFAFSEPAWKNCTLDVYTHYFPEDQEISYAIWNIWITIGLAVGFLWSPVFCVDAKMYIQIGLVLVAVTCYGLAEFLHRRGIRRAKREEEK